MSTRKLLSQLGHVEVATPSLEESARFYIDVLGMTEVARDDGSIYLKCWGEWLHNSVILTEASEAGIVHVGWRTQGEEELGIAAERLEASGAGIVTVSLVPSASVTRNCIEPLIFASRRAKGPADSRARRASASLGVTGSFGSKVCVSIGFLLDLLYHTIETNAT